MSLLGLMVSEEYILMSKDVVAGEGSWGFISLTTNPKHREWIRDHTSL